MLKSTLTTAMAKAAKEWLLKGCTGFASAWITSSLRESKWG
jgi:hypothetical protein